MSRNAGWYIALFVFGLACAAALPGLLQLRVNPDATKDSLPQTGRRAEIYDRYLELFPPDYGGAVVLKGELCTEEHWTLFQELTADLEASPVVQRVIALSTTEYVSGEGDTVEVADFADLEIAEDDSYCRIAAAYPPYRDLLISADGQAVAIYLVAKKDVDAVRFSDRIEKVLAPHLDRFKSHSNIQFFQTGEMHASAELSRLTTQSMRLLPAALLLMVVVAWIRTRSLAIAALSALTGVAAVYFTLAAVGYTGWMLNPVTSVVMNMLIPLGTAFTVHAAVYLRETRQLILGYFPRAAARPYLLATATTCIGFGATALTDAPQVRQMGFMGVFGILACAFTAATFTFPILTATDFLRGRPSEERDLPRFLQFSFGLSKPWLATLVIAMMVLAAVGMFRLRVDYGPIDYFTKDNPVYRHIEVGAEEFGRYAIPLVVFQDEEGAVLEPNLWNELHEFVSEMESKFPGLHAAWMYDQLAELSRAFTADRAEPLAFPDSRELLAQFLILFDEADTEVYLDWNRTALTIMLQVPFKRSSEYMGLKEDVDRFREVSGINARLTGRVASFFEEGEEIAWDNLKSTCLGIGVVFLFFIGLFRAPRLAFFGVFANALPVFGTLSAMGLLGVPLDFGSSIVAAIALGLVLDDTGHLLARYYGYKREGIAPPDAVRQSLEELWRPIVTTTVTTIVGFSIMNFANLVPFHTFSRLLSAAMLYALVGDLVILPGLLKHFDQPTKGAAGVHANVPPTLAE